MWRGAPPPPPPLFFFTAIDGEEKRY